MTPDIAGCQPFEPIPGMGLHRYLCEAARFFDIEQYLRLGRKVQSARLREDDSWEITYVSCKDASYTTTVVAKRLVVATGLASEPYMPDLPGQERFTGLLMHAKQLNAKADELAKARNVIVLGGNKSAYDACYHVAQNGGTAHMVLRPSGGGPSFQWPGLISLFGRIIALPMLTSIRLFTLFDPWPFSIHKPWIREFLHRWKIGLKITQWFWNKVTAAYTQRLTAYERTGMLVPWTSAYWMGTSLGSLNYPEDWHKLVREGRIVVHHADVVSISSSAVDLTDGKVDDVDAVVCCTGWISIPAIKFPPGDLDLGLESLPEEFGDEQALADEARNSILKERPFLANPPRKAPKPYGKTQEQFRATPCRLYRYMIPPTKRFLQSCNLAFLAADNPLHFVTATQVQALWITAFFDGRMHHLQSTNLGFQQVRNDTVLLTEYERLRRPKLAGGVGEKHGEFVFDCLPYLDLLLHDIGLQQNRKRTIWKEWFEPYGMADYEGLVEEWMRSRAGL